MVVKSASSRNVLQRLIQEWAGLHSTPGQGIRCSQGGGEQWDVQPDIGALAESQATFELRDGHLEVSLAEMQQTNIQQCQGNTVGLFDLFGQPYRVFSHAAPRSDLP